MTDRELLELAAKAAGIEGEWVEDSLLDDYYKLPTTGVLTVSEGRTHVWNALTSSGDALRLAVKLEIDLKYNHGSVTAIYTRTDSIRIGLPNRSEVDGDEYQDHLAATRRAIVRAAAEIWKGEA